MADPHWSRPNPPRLNDTDAIIRKGTYPWTYQASGTKLPNMMELPYTAEVTFNGRSASKFSRRTGPTEEGPALVVACKQIPKAC